MVTTAENSQCREPRGEVLAIKLGHRPDEQHTQQNEEKASAKSDECAYSNPAVGMSPLEKIEQCGKEERGTCSCEDDGG